MAWLKDLHLFKGTVIYIIISLLYLRQTFGELKNYKFRLGANASIPFSYTFIDDSEHCWEIFRVGVSDPFNINGTMYPDALNPTQRDRFCLRSTWKADSLSVDLHIRNVSALDRGVYVWAVSSHGLRVKRLVETFDVFLDVIIPPERARCKIEPSPYSNDLREVHCKAKVGNDGGGQLICYQGSDKATFQSAPIISGTTVTGVFWMNIKKSIRCCSHEVNYEKGPWECNDFTQPATITPTSTTKPLATRTQASTTLNILRSRIKTMATTLSIDSERTSDSSTYTKTTEYTNDCNNRVMFIIFFVASLCGNMGLIVTLCVICAKYRYLKMKMKKILQDSTTVIEMQRMNPDVRQEGPKGDNTSEKDACED